MNCSKSIMKSENKLLHNKKYLKTKKNLMKVNSKKFP